MTKPAKIYTWKGKSGLFVFCSPNGERSSYIVNIETGSSHSPAPHMLQRHADPDLERVFREVADPHVLSKDRVAKAQEIIAHRRAAARAAMRDADVAAEEQAVARHAARAARAQEAERARQETERARQVAERAQEAERVRQETALARQLAERAQAAREAELARQLAERAQAAREAERARQEAAREAELARQLAERAQAAREAERVRQVAERAQEAERVRQVAERAQAAREAERARQEAAREAEHARQVAERARQEAAREAERARQEAAVRVRREVERFAARLLAATSRRALESDDDAAASATASADSETDSASREQTLEEREAELDRDQAAVCTLLREQPDGAVAAAAMDGLPRELREGCVYIIRAGDTDCYKIGMSNHPSIRRSQLQTGNHEALALLYVSDVLSNAMQLEQAYHRSQRGQPHHIHREWYRFTGGVAAALNSLVSVVHEQQRVALAMHQA